MATGSQRDLRPGGNFYDAGATMTLQELNTQSQRVDAARKLEDERAKMMNCRGLAEGGKYGEVLHFIPAARLKIYQEWMRRGIDDVLDRISKEMEAI